MFCFWPILAVAAAACCGGNDNRGCQRRNPCPGGTLSNETSFPPMRVTCAWTPPCPCKCHSHKPCCND